MAVYVIPYRGSNFWGAFGQGVGLGMGGLVSNLLGAQLQGMIDRGNEARKVRQREKANAAMPENFLDMSRQEQQYAYLTNPMTSLFSEDERKNWWSHIEDTEKTRGQDELRTSTSNMYGPDAAGIVTGALRAEADPTTQGMLTERAMPKYVRNEVDQGDKIAVRYTNEFNPNQSVELGHSKGLSPQDLLNAKLMREGMANALEQAKAKGIVSGLTGKAGGSSWGPEDFAKYRAEILAQMQNLDEESEAYKNLADQLYAMDKFIGSIYGYGWGSPQPQAMPQAASQAQVNATARQIMDEARARGIDISMSQALEEARRALGITQ